MNRRCPVSKETRLTFAGDGMFVQFSLTDKTSASKQFAGHAGEAQTKFVFAIFTNEVGGYFDIVFFFVKNSETY